MNGLATRQRLRTAHARAAHRTEPPALPIDRIVFGVCLVLLIVVLADQIFAWRIFG